MTATPSISATNLRDIRREAGATQHQVAAMLGIDHTSVSSIERGGRALSHAEQLVLEAYFFGTPLPQCPETRRG